MDKTCDNSSTITNCSLIDKSVDPSSNSRIADNNHSQQPILYNNNNSE